MKLRAAYSSDLAAEHAPAVVDVWFRMTESEQDIALDGRGDRSPWSEILEAVDDGAATLIDLDVDRVPSAPEGRAVLLPAPEEVESVSQGTVKRALDAMSVLRASTVSHSAAVSLAYGSRDQVRSLLDGLGREYYDRACRNLGNGDFPGAEANILKALRCYPRSAHAPLLAAQLAKIGGQPTARVFTQQMSKWAVTLDPGLQGVHTTMPPEHIAPSLYHWERELWSENPNASLVAEHWSTVSKLRHFTAYLDVRRQRLRDLGLTHPSARKTYWSVATRVVDRLIALKPKSAVDRFYLMAMQDALGKAREAIESAQTGLQLASADPDDANFLLRSGMSDAYRILGRHAWSNRSRDEAVRLLRLAQHILIQLKDQAGTQKMHRWTSDRLAQATFILARISGDREQLQDARELYLSLVNNPDNKPTGKQLIYLAECAALLGAREECQDWLAKYEKHPFYTRAEHERVEAMLLSQSPDEPDLDAFDNDEPFFAAA